jgi:hypothetical protein
MKRRRRTRSRGLGGTSDEHHEMAYDQLRMGRGLLDAANNATTCEGRTNAALLALRHTGAAHAHAFELGWSKSGTLMTAIERADREASAIVKSCTKHESWWRR